MNLSLDGLLFIQAHEGFRSMPYDDAAGYCTVGTGHLLYTGKCAEHIEENPYKKGITKEQGRALLGVDSQRFQAVVQSNVKVLLTQNQFDALVSFAYNVGASGFKHSTVLAKVNAGKHDQVPNELRKYVNGGKPKKRIQGLVNRREAEIKLYAGK